MSVAAVVAATGLLAALAWVASGMTLPGGRWAAVHLFTLGVLSPLVLGFSQHFGATLTRAAGQPRIAPVVVAAVGALSTVYGVVAARPGVTATGGTLVTVAVLAAYVQLRRWRRQAVGARFAWIVRLYERAHGAFVHGAVLGVAMAVGALDGAWYGPARLAHIHVVVLGWGVVTLLATWVFFGPTILRRRIAPGADARAATVLRTGAASVTLSALLLLASGVGGTWGTIARIGAGVALGILAVAAAVVCRPILSDALRAPAASRARVVGISAWLPTVLFADALVVATGWWRGLDAIGVVLFIAVLLQAVLATVVHVAPLQLAEHGPARDRMHGRLEAATARHAGALNLGAALIAGCALLGTDLGVGGAVVVRVGLVLVAWGALGPLWMLRPSTSR